MGYAVSSSLEPEDAPYREFDAVPTADPRDVGGCVVTIWLVCPATAA